MSYSKCLLKSTQETGSLKRTKILITGCSSGIGYYTAKKLHQEGYYVIASCRKTEDVERLKLEGFHAVHIDLDNSASITQGVKDTLSITNQSLDILINNGAYGQPGAIEDLSRLALEKQFSTNVFGTHELTTKLIKTLLKSDKPRIIQISSILGLSALCYRGAYASSKYALEGLTDTMRLEFANTKLRISLIEPGPITSAFRQNAKKAFLTHIDYLNSRHIDQYKMSLKRFNSDKPQKFTLSEKAVYQRIITIIHSDKPKPRYYVTKPTYYLGFLKRILSARLLDKILLKISNQENNHFSDSQ